MALSIFQQQCLADLGCYDSRHMATMQPCEIARRCRAKITRKLMTEALRDGGDIIQIGGVTKSRAQYLKALEDLLSWTYEICELAAKEQGPFAMHVAPDQCGDDPCFPRRHRYARRMW